MSDGLENHPHVRTLDATAARPLDCLQVNEVALLNDQSEGLCTYYVIMDGGGYLQMITVLRRGGPPNDYVIIKGWSGK